MQKTKETLGKLSKRDLLFWHVMVIHGPQNGPKTIIFPNALFLHFSWDFSDVIGRRSYPKTPKKTFVYQRSSSKVPNHALEKVLNQRNTLYSVQLVFCRHFLFKSIATPCFFEFSAPMYMCPCCDSHISPLFGLHVSESKRASQLQSLTS